MTCANPRCGRAIPPTRQSANPHVVTRWCSERCRNQAKRQKRTRREQEART